MDYDNCPTAKEDGHDPLTGVRGVYNYGARPRRDVGFAVLYVLLMFTTLAGGLYGYHGMNGDFLSDDFSDMSKCAASPPEPANVLGASEDSDSDTLTSHFWKRAAVLMSVTVLVTPLFGYGLLKSMFHYGSQLVFYAMALNLGTLFLGGFLLCFYSLSSALFYFFLAALWGLVWYLWRDRLELVARLFSVASAGLKENPHFISLALAVKSILLLVLIPMVLCAVAALSNGHMVSNSSVTSQVDGKCFASTGEVHCCAWETDGWVFPYVFFVALAILWTIMLAFEIRLFSVSGAVSQWYFMPAGHNTTGTTLSSLKLAFGPSFGTLCLGSLVLTFVEILRTMTESARRRRNNFFMMLIACFLECIYALVEFISKFATIFAAITGESFCASASEVTGLLKRNFISSYAVWWLPKFVLRTVAVSLALLWGVLVALCFYAEESARHVANASNEAVVVAVICAAIVLVVLSFFITLMIDIIEVIYLCYVMDLDRNEESKPEVHAVFVAMPMNNTTSGAAVQQPGGSYAYAAPSPVSV